MLPPRSSAAADAAGWLVSPAARQVLDDLLVKYADFGLNQLDDLQHVLRVPPFDERGSVVEIVALFGGAEELKKAVEQMQVLLYE